MMFVFYFQSIYLAGKYQKKTQKTIEKTSKILPVAFLERIKTQFYADYERFINSMDQTSAVSLRINPRKFKMPVSAEPVPWCFPGFFLNERPSFTLDPIFHSGAYYVQEASSMFVEKAFEQTESHGSRLVLDLCAAPGGKSTHLLSLLNPDDLLVSNEVIRSRVSVLDENLKKWGYQNVVITNNDPADFRNMEGVFDLILVDAPCSGEGLFRRDASAIDQWSVENTNLCATRQRRILADIWPALKTDGYLIYSTCTFNPGENEENLKWLAENKQVESIPIPLQEGWGIEEVEINGLHGYRFLPHKVKGEGFFLTLIRKKDGVDPFPFSKKTKLKFEKIPKQFTRIRNWLLTPNSEFFIKNEFIISFSDRWVHALSSFSEHLRIIRFGLPVAQFKKNDLLPEHTLALSVDRNPHVFETVELNLNDALLFLKKDEIRIPSSVKGWLIVQYQNIPLGFVKNLGSRVNNYFPKEWRIRMALTDIPQSWYL
jgi:16S rRNA C967 or C1407 C5-methylase (RsmB/RsmF family)/NOL1/NOP2/fmu family ribosome biogenesis protein